MTGSRTIVGIGEALFDVFPDGRRLGGAPLNVAVHAHQLGNAGVVVSRVGYDALGDQIAAALRDRSMTLDHLQRDPDRPTGTVNVELTSSNEPAYDILPNVAWDNLQWDGDLDHLAVQCHAVCFGTLAQREAQTRNTIYRFLETAEQAVRLFDVNLRQDFHDRRSITRSLELSSAAKLNRDELGKLAGLLDLPAGDDETARQLMQRYSLQWVAVTRGPDGTIVYTPDAKHDAPPVSASGQGGDAVGAGDATSAALLHGILRRWPWEKTLKLANTLGAYVASQSGACPQLTDELKALAEGK